MSDFLQSSLSGCGCGSLSTRQVCGTFETPQNPDLGACCPPAVKRTCDAPTYQRGQCPGETPVAISGPPWVILTQIFDQNCLPILDEDNNIIFTTTTI